MNTTVAPATPTDPPRTRRSTRSASPIIVHRTVVALTLFVALAALGLGVTLVTGVTLAFNILVLALFTVLWIAFAMALVFSPRTLDDIWHSFRGLPLIVQVLLVFLLLPIAIGLWIWERSWSLPTRLVLIVALGIGNILMFFPQTAGAS